MSLLSLLKKRFCTKIYIQICRNFFAKIFTITFLSKTFLFIIFSVIQIQVKALEVDWSKRISTRNMTTSFSSGSPHPSPSSFSTAPFRQPATSQDSVTVTIDDSTAVNQEWLNEVFQGPREVQQIVVLHTQEGFLPKQVMMNTSTRYELILVNVHPSQKLASYFLDDMGVQEESMPFGEVKKIILVPKKAGVYSLYSPESGWDAQVVVIDLAKPLKKARAK